MKKYLLLVVCVFAISNSCKNEQKIEKKQDCQEVVAIKNDSIELLKQENFTQKYFSLNSNEESLYFFHRNGIENPEDFVILKLLETNITKDQRHPLISYEPRNNRKFRINSVRVLNHRWLICDFSDGLDWGELLVAYYLSDDNKSLEFKVFDSTLYISEGKAYQN